jgi:hypothetical protein
MGRTKMADYDVEVLVRGRPVRVFTHNGDHFIEGRKGSSFELRVTNRTWSRIEVVASVDGLSVINGEESGVNSEGYIVEANDTIIIPGWKLPDNKAAQFVFEDKRSSYSNQTGNGTTNVGVIGLMVFEEKVVTKPVGTPMPYPVPYPVPSPQIPPYKPHPWFPNTNPTETWKWRGDGVMLSTTAGDDIPESFIASSVGLISNNAGTSRRVDITKSVVPQADALFDIGTGWGSEVSHNVTTVSFERRDYHNPNTIISLFYDAKNGLEARGIEVVKSKKKKSPKLPNAFPTYKNSSCKPPKGWKG